MRKRLTKKQLRVYGAAAIAAAALIVLAMLIERWVVFLPFSFAVYLKWAVFGSCVACFSLFCFWRIKKGYRTTIRGYASLPFGILLFAWMFMEAVYGCIAASNSISSNPERIICLNIVSNMNDPEGIISRTHSIYVTIQGKGVGSVEVVRYRYPEINFRYLASGDSVQVLARPGWAGYSLEKVVARGQCQRGRPGAAQWNRGQGS